MDATGRPAGGVAAFRSGASCFACRAGRVLWRQPEARSPRAPTCCTSKPKENRGWSTSTTRSPESLKLEEISTAWQNDSRIEGRTAIRCNTRHFESGSGNRERQSTIGGHPPINDPSGVRVQPNGPASGPRSGAQFQPRVAVGYRAWQCGEVRGAARPAVRRNPSQAG